MVPRSDVGMPTWRQKSDLILGSVLGCANWFRLVRDERSMPLVP